MPSRGNSGIDKLFSRKAPKGQYRIIGVDTFDGSDWHEKDFQTFEEAVKHADKQGSTMLKMYIYDENGKYLYEAGTF